MIEEMVPRSEMLDALAEQRRRIGKENDDQIIAINTMRNNLWTLFNAACDVSRFDWSSEGLDADADEAISRLAAAVDAIKAGRPLTFPAPVLAVTSEMIERARDAAERWDSNVCMSNATWRTALTAALVEPPK